MLLRIVPIGFIAAAALSFALQSALAANLTGSPTPLSTVFGTVSAIQGNCTTGSHTSGKPKPLCSFTVTTVNPPASVDIAATTATQFEAFSSAAVVSGFRVTDAVLVRARQGDPMTAKIVKFNPKPFPVPPVKVHTFTGKFVSLNSTTSPSQLTISHSGVQMVFTVRAKPKTKYEVNGKTVYNPTFKAGDRLKVWSVLYTDSNQWTTQVAITRRK